MSDDKTEIRRSEEDPNTRESADAEATPAVPSIEIRARLGQGGMASVYEALDLGFTPPRKVAVKFMDRAISADAEFRGRFEREAALVASFRHDNIVHVFSSGEAEGSKYIVMEYLEGGTLTDRIHPDALSASEAIRIAAALASALAYSHDRGIIHRDLKPANVLFTSDGKPVLSDFGVAKSVSGDGNLTRHAMVIGAPRYMAPEQALGAEITDRADIYSLGLVIMEMLTAKSPPVGWRLENAELAKMLPRATPRHVVELIRRCLQVNPASRPSAAECHETLTDLRAPSAPGWRSVALGVLAMSLVAATVYWWPKGAPDSSHDARLNIIRSPGSAMVYVNDREVGPNVELRTANEQLVAVAPGFYGEVRQIVSSPESTQDISVALQTVKLPAREEYDRFEVLADTDMTPVITPAQVEEIGERTLQTALRLRLLQQNGETVAFEKLNSELDALGRHGDARAIVARLLGQSIREGRIGPSSISNGLVAASESGDAMASFYFATALRGGLSESETAVAPVEFQRYCARLALASAQGWPDVARKLSEPDGCK